MLHYNTSSFISINVAIANTNQPKPFLSFTPSTRLASEVPIKIPTTAIAVKLSRNIQSISICPKSPVKPINELIDIIKSEVPTACFIDKFPNSIKAGTITNPPPAPISPVKKPIIAA